MSQMSRPEQLEKKMERSEVGSKRCKGNEVKLMIPKILKGSSLSGIEDGDIPEWLLVELLVRLPVKVVYRFKLVSKQWLSVISNPYFVRSHVSRASLLSRPWTIVSPFMLHKCSESSQVLDYGLLEDLNLKPSISAVSVPSIHQPQEEGYIILGVSSGLVLYGLMPDLREEYSVNNSYYICNPLTGHCIVLPPLTCDIISSSWVFLTHVEDCFLKSYLVVQLQPPIQGSSTIIFQVYVSEIGEWKKFSVSTGNYFPLYLHSADNALNGNLHWIAKGLGIIAYDPYENPESMRVIAFPGGINPEMQSFFYSLCAAYEGKLRYLELGYQVVSGKAFPSFRIWVLDDYNSGDWCLQHNISHTDVQYDANFRFRRHMCESIYFHPFDSDIVYLDYGRDFVSFSITTRKLQVEDEFLWHKGNVLTKRCAPRRITPFLFVIPYWPISIPLP